VTGFEGSFLGDASRIGDNAVMECGVCWWKYDPALGDEVWQIAPGTAFLALPDYWRCPNCDAPQTQFMLHTANSDSRPHETPPPGAVPEQVSTRREALRQAYLQAEQRMRDLPVYNAGLSVTVSDMHRCEQGLVAVVTTPWCMNLVLLPVDAATRRREGTSREVQFPSGSYSFTAAFLEGLGGLETCSLFSPMDDFAEQQVAEEVAASALSQLFDKAETDSQGKRPAAGQQAVSRREFLRGGRASTV